MDVVSRPDDEERGEDDHSSLTIEGYYSEQDQYLPPQLIERYEILFPGYGRKMLDVSFEETKNRQLMERRGQLLGYSIQVLGVVGSLVASAISQNAYVAVASVFICAICIGGPYAAEQIVEIYSRSVGGNKKD